MQRIFGNYFEDLSDSQANLTLIFSPCSLPTQQHWRNNGLAANFMADYFTTLLTTANAADSISERASELKNIISFVANELLENAVKFGNHQIDSSISITLDLYQANLHPIHLVFIATNQLDQSAADRFQNFIQTLLSADPEQLMLHQIEKNAENPEQTGSGLGTLILINDYSATMGWKFEPLPNYGGIYTVKTMVSLIV